MHHSNQDISNFNDEIFKKLNEKQKLGATGRFPEGKLVEHDEGEIQFSIETFKNKIVLNFNKSVKWVGMNKQQAKELGELLIKRSELIEQ